MSRFERRGVVPRSGSATAPKTGGCDPHAQRFGSRDPEPPAPGRDVQIHGRVAPTRVDHLKRRVALTEMVVQNDGVASMLGDVQGGKSRRTTKLSDRTSDQITLDEIERIVI